GRTRTDGIRKHIDPSLINPFDGNPGPASGAAGLSGDDRTAGPRGAGIHAEQNFAFCACWIADRRHGPVGPDEAICRGVSRFAVAHDHRTVGVRSPSSALARSRKVPEPGHGAGRPAKGFIFAAAGRGAVPDDDGAIGTYAGGPAAATAIW